jgi:hypothetical protein
LAPVELFIAPKTSGYIDTAGLTIIGEAARTCLNICLDETTVFVERDCKMQDSNGWSG